MLIVISQALLLGMGAGFIPSPHTYFCYESFRRKHNIFKPAILIGLVIDLLILSLFTLGILKRLPLIPVFFLGSIFFLKNSYKILKNFNKANPHISFTYSSAIKSHLFNPNPYLFWIFIGSDFLTKEYNLIFVFTFLCTMLFCKLMHISLLNKMEIKKNAIPFIRIRNLLVSSIYSFYGLKLLTNIYFIYS